ncbi:hypothetical protein Bca101_043917 [Brassica carinata]
MGPKTRGGIVHQVRRSRRTLGFEAVQEIVIPKTKLRKLNKAKEVAIAEENVEIRQEGDGEEGTLPHSKEAENVIAEEPSQPTEAENGVIQDGDEVEEDETLPHSKEAENVIDEEPSQPTEAENGVTQEPSQPREADMDAENGISGAEAPPSDGKPKKKRGPTKMRKVAKDPQEKVSVSFTELGEHVGPGSVTLSSFLGPLVREHVTVLLDDWSNLGKQTKDTLWEEIQVRNIMKINLKSFVYMSL